MKYVFISYSNKNKQEADVMRGIFTENGIECWMAPYSIPAGGNYAAVIDNAINGCECMLLILSEDAQQSGFVEREIERAATYKKKIITLQVDDCELEAGFRFFIGTSQITKVYQIDKNMLEIERIVDAVLQCVGKTEVDTVDIDVLKKDYNKGLELYRAKQYSQAAALWLKCAESGFAMAQNNLGTCCENGTGVETDYVAAAAWYEKAACQGNYIAQSNLGRCYEYGRGVERNLTEAIRLYKLSADQGFAQAQYNLALHYHNGNGVERNAELAVKYYMKAAYSGVALAQNNLGVCFENGDGIERNLEQAVLWYRKAAEQGLAEAQCNLGECYFFGKGVKQDAFQAKTWFIKSASGGNARAKKNLRVGFGLTV